MLFRQLHGQKRTHCSCAHSQQHGHMMGFHHLRCFDQQRHAKVSCLDHRPPRCGGRRQNRQSSALAAHSTVAQHHQPSPLRLIANTFPPSLLPPDPPPCPVRRPTPPSPRCQH